MPQGCIPLSRTQPLTYTTMADTTGSSNTAIVAILVIVLLVVIGFFAFSNVGGAGEVEVNEPDIEVEVTPPGDTGGDPGDGGN